MQGRFPQRFTELADASPFGYSKFDPSCVIYTHNVSRENLKQAFLDLSPRDRQNLKEVVFTEYSFPGKKYSLCHRFDWILTCGAIPLTPIVRMPRSPRACNCQ
jgi:hypothetical protein